MTSRFYFAWLQRTRATTGAGTNNELRWIGDGGQVPEADVDYSLNSLVSRGA